MRSCHIPALINSGEDNYHLRLKHCLLPGLSMCSFFVFKQMRISDRDSIDCKQRIISCVITDDSAQKNSGTALYTRCTAHDNPVSVVLRLGLTTSSLTSLSRVCILLAMLNWRGSSNAGVIKLL